MTELNIIKHLKEYRSFLLTLLLIYVFLFIIRPWEVLFPWLGAIRFEMYYFLLMLLVLFGSRQKRPFNIDLQTFTVFAFAFALSMSYLFSINPALAWPPLYKFLTLVLMYIVIIMAIRSPSDIFLVAAVYIFTMLIYLAKAQWEFFLHGGGQYRMGVRRLVGIEMTFSNPNSLASSIVLSLPFLYFLWANRNRLTTSCTINQKKLFSIFLLSYAALALSSIALTNSRSGMLGFICFLILTVVYNQKNMAAKVKKMMWVGVCLLLIWMVMPTEQKSRFRTIWDQESGPVSATQSARGRIEGYLDGVEMFKRYPMTGVGIGNFASYRGSRLNSEALQSHNLYGQALGETGILGAGFFLLMVLVAFKRCNKTIKRSKMQSDDLLDILSDFSIACKSTLILLFIAGLTGHNLMRFNWLWMAAFSSVAFHFSQERLAILNDDTPETDSEPHFTE